MSNTDQMLRARVVAGRLQLFLPDGQMLDGQLTATMHTPAFGRTVVTLSAFVADEDSPPEPARRHQPAGSGSGGGG